MLLHINPLSTVYRSIAESLSHLGMVLRQQEVLGGTNCLFSFHVLLDTTWTAEKTPSSTIVCVFIAARMCLPRHCLATLGEDTVR
jgi:hypothetical protein